MPEDVYIADDLITDDPYAVLSARQGYLIGQRLTTLENASGSGSGGSYQTATDSEIDAIFA